MLSKSKAGRQTRGGPFIGTRGYRSCSLGACHALFAFFLEVKLRTACCRQVGGGLGERRGCVGAALHGGMR